MKTKIVLFLLLGLFSLLTITQPVSASIYDNVFSYKNQITITNNNLTRNISIGTPIEITVDTASLISAGKMKADGSDFVINFRSTDSDLLIDRINLTPFNTANTIIAFAITEHDIGAGGSTDAIKNYTMYYGNASYTIPASLTNGADIYDLYYDFDDLATTGWTVNTGSFTATDGYLKGTAGTSSASASNSKTNFETYEVVFDIRDSDTDGSEFVYPISSTTNIGSSNGYSLLFDTSSTPIWRKSSGGTHTTLITGNALSTNTWYEIKITMTPDRNFSMYVDGSYIGSAVESTYDDSTYYIFEERDTASGSGTDNVRVTYDFTYPLPTSSFGGEQLTSPQAAWANTNYTNRTRIIVTNNNQSNAFPAGSTFNVSFVNTQLGNTYDFNNFFSAGCNNLRVYENNTNVWRELDRRVFYCEAGTTKLTVAFKSPVAIPAGGSNSNFWLYWGNNTPITTAAPEDWNKIYFLADNFEDGVINTSIWDVVTSSGSVQEGNGSLYINNNGDSWFLNYARTKYNYSRVGDVGFVLYDSLNKTNSAHGGTNFAWAGSDVSTANWYVQSSFHDDANYIRFFTTSYAAGTGETGNLKTRMFLNQNNGTVLVAQIKETAGHTETVIQKQSNQFIKDNLPAWLLGTVTAGGITEHFEFHSYYWLSGGYTGAISFSESYTPPSPPDTTPPTITIVSPTATTYTTTTIPLNVYANEVTHTWWYNLGAGNVTFTPNTTITGSEGVNNLVVYANDTSGNVGQASVSFTVDTTAPVITISSPQAITYNTASISLAVSAGGVVHTWWYNNGAANITFTPNTTITANEGVNNLVVYANDSVGNTGQATVTFGVDTIPPFVNIISPQAATYNTSLISLSVIADASAVSWWYNIGASNVSFTPNITLNLSDATYTLKVYANDSIGNVGDDSVTFTVDTTVTPPEPPITPPLDVGFPFTTLVAMVIIIASLIAVVGLGLEGKITSQNFVQMFIIVVIATLFAVIISGI